MRHIKGTVVLYAVLLQLCGLPCSHANDKDITFNVAEYGAIPDDSGSDDTHAIQAAIDAAHKSWRKKQLEHEEDESQHTVFLPSGEYHVTEALELLSGVTLEGETDQQGNLNTHIVDVKGQAKALLRCHWEKDLTLRNLRIRSEVPDDQPGADYLIYMKYCSDVTVDSVEAKSFERYAIYLNNTSNSRVLNSKIGSAINLQERNPGSGVLLTDNSSSNQIVDSEFLPPLRHAVIVQRKANNNQISSNVIKGTIRDGIILRGQGESGNIIEYNKIHDAEFAGIGIGHNDKIVTGSGNKIQNNLIYGCYRGIDLKEGHSGRPVTGTIIRYNKIFHTVSQAIHVQHGESTWLYGNMIYGTQGDFDIEVENMASTFSEFSDNVCVGASIAAGIRAPEHIPLSKNDC